ncbi:Uncharacterised protein [Vibrio cholerae]|nr:Uncharacterised protein [Vibrio cholerae]
MRAHKPARTVSGRLAQSRPQHCSLRVHQDGKGDYRECHRGWQG